MNRGRSFRVLNINSVLSDAIKEIFVRDMELQGCVYVGQTKLNKAKTVFYVCIGGGAIDELNNKKGWIRSLLAKKVKMRFVPELVFIEDKSVEEFMNLVEKMDQNA